MHFLDQSLHQHLDPFEALLHIAKQAQSEWDYKYFKLLDEMMGPHTEEPLETKWEVALHKLNALQATNAATTGPSAVAVTHPMEVENAQEGCSAIAVVKHQANLPDVSPQDPEDETAGAPMCVNTQQHFEMVFRQDLCGPKSQLLHGHPVNPPRCPALRISSFCIATRHKGSQWSVDHGVRGCCD